MIRLFKVSVPSSILVLLISEIVLLISSYVLAVYWSVEAPDVFLLDENGIASILIVVVAVVLGLYFADLYEDYRVRSRILLFQQFCMILGVAFLVQAFLNYGRWTSLAMPKWAMLAGSMLALVVMPVWRITFSSLVRTALGSQKILFLGSSPAVREIVWRIAERPELGLASMGYLDNDAASPLDLYGARKLGRIPDLKSVVEAQRPDSIVVGMSERRQNLPIEDLLHLRLSGIYVEDVAATYQRIFHRVSTRDLRPSELIFSTELGPKQQKIAVQSFYSLLISIAGLAIAWPLLIIVALLVKLTSSGPVFYSQTRVGMNGAPFTLYKFRSMFADAERGGPRWASKDDPRVTRLGRWLRKLRLDELPQLFNVLRGEMSIVGPRPERPEFVRILEEKMPYYRLRHCVKPGITGWAQINHKYGDTIEDSILKLEYDLYYIKNMALSLDAYIIFQTAKTMLLARGSQ